MTNEYDSDTFGRTPDSQEPVNAADGQTAPSFETNGFGSEPQNAAPGAQEQTGPEEPAAQTEEPAFQAEESPVQAEEPAAPAEEQFVYAERVQGYGASAGAYRAQGNVPPYGQSSVPPYGRQNSVPPYGQQTYGQTAQPQSPYYTRPNTYGAPTYAGTQPAAQQQKSPKRD